MTGTTVTHETRMAAVDEVLAEVRAEIEHAVGKHGPIASPHEGHSVILESSIPNMVIIEKTATASRRCWKRVPYPPHASPCKIISLQLTGGQVLNDGFAPLLGAARTPAVADNGPVRQHVAADGPVHREVRGSVTVAIERRCPVSLPSAHQRVVRGVQVQGALLNRQCALGFHGLGRTLAGEPTELVGSGTSRKHEQREQHARDAQESAAD